MAKVYLCMVLVLHIIIPRVSTEETVVEEIMPLRPSGFDGHHRVRRLASESVMTEAEKTIILNKHNELRGQTTPAAGNMRFMVSDKC